MLSKKLKIVHVQASALLKNKVAEGTEEGKEIWRCLKEGDPLPDETFQNIIKDRLDQLDVKMNGFVLDGFPLNSNQMRFLLDTCNIKPSHLIFLELNDHKAYERLEYRMFDPVSGIYYNNVLGSKGTSIESGEGLATLVPPKDETVIKRLIHSPEDEHHVVKKCIKRHKEFVMDLQKKLDVDDLIIINADNKPDTVFLDISSEIGM